MSYLRVGKDLWGNNFVRTECLSRIDEGRKDFASLFVISVFSMSTALGTRLFTFTCTFVSK